MKAIETAAGLDPSGTAETGPDAARPSANEVADWLLEGRFFTIDPAGVVTTWSPVAAGAFGWHRDDIVGQSFAATLLAPPARALEAERLARLLAGEAPGCFTGDVDALAEGERPLRAAFAIVPIRLGAGYEFNELLHEVAARPPGGDARPADARSRHESAAELIRGALGGTGAELGGALVVFRAGQPGPVGSATSAERGGNVVSIADAAGVEEARAQLDRARRDAEQGRIEIRNLEGQLEEARRESQRSRNEVDVARQAEADARDALIVAQRESEEARRHLDDSRRAADEVRAAGEAARIASEEAQREAASLRGQLREARESLRGMAGRADEELAEAQERAAVAARELADARAEVTRHQAEVAPLRERYQTAQRELGELHADLESARAAAAERETVGERRAGELDRTRAALARARSESEANAARAAEAEDELESVREQLERAQAALGQAPAGAALVAAESGGATGEAVRRALEDDLFELHCQPVLDLRSNAVTQYELLLRMSSGDGRLIAPEAFLGTARRAGLAHAIDRWVVRRAIRLLHETARAGHEVSLEVNLSPEAVDDAELPGLVEEELAAASVDPARLVLEVSGATAAEDAEATAALAKRLRALGCRFALDEFRSNFGAFQLLRELPLDYLKLDGELVGSLAESRTSQLIVKALVDVAAGTGLKTVAVYVSDEETLGLLRQHGVDYAQGYTVGRPRPAREALGTGAPRELPRG